MSWHTSHPLADAWLRDLELLLHGIDPGERAEVLAGVREHLDVSLGVDATDDDVRRVIADLGSPQSVADEAYAGRPAPRATTPGSTWLGITASCMNALGIALVTLLSWSVPGPLEVVAVGALFVLPWCVVVVLSMLTPAWTARERVTSALLYPVTTLACAAVGEVMVRVFGPRLTNMIPMVVLLSAAVWVLVRLVKANRSAR